MPILQAPATATGWLSHLISKVHIFLRIPTQFGAMASFLIKIAPKKILRQFESGSSEFRFLNLAGWSLLSFAIEKVAQASIIIFLARTLGVSDYGRLNLSQGLINTAQLVMMLGSGTVLSRFIPAYRNEHLARAVGAANACLLFLAGMIILTSFMGVLGAGYIRGSLLDLNTASRVPYWLICWVAFAAIGSLFQTILLSFEQGRSVMIVSTIVAIAFFTLVPILTYAEGLEGAIRALAFTEAIRAVACVILYRSFLRKTNTSAFSRPMPGDSVKMLIFGGPVFLSATLWGPTIWASQVILKYSGSGGLEAVGVFGFANNILGFVLLLTTTTNRAALPVFSSLSAAGQSNKLRKLTRFVVIFQASAAAVIAIPIAIFSNYIMAKMGPSFAPYGHVLALMAVTGVILSALQPFVNLLLVHDRSLANAFVMAAWAITILAAQALLPIKGATGLAVAFALAAMIRFGSVVVLSKPHWQFRTEGIDR